MKNWIKATIAGILTLGTVVGGFFLRGKKNTSFWDGKTEFTAEQYGQANVWFSQRKLLMLVENEVLKDTKLPKFYFDSNMREDWGAFTKGDVIVTTKFTESYIKHESTHFVLEHNGRPADPNHIDKIGIKYYRK